jgi:hypothetical protein
VTRVLVTGVPRSGTSWVGTVLGRTPGATYVEEPDNHFRHAFAFAAKRALAQREYPRLEHGQSSPRYERLWSHAFGERGAGRGPVSRWRHGAAELLHGHAHRLEIAAALGAGQRVTPTLRAAAALALPERPTQSAAHVVVKSVHSALALEWIVERHEPRVLVLLRDPLNVLSSWQVMDWLGRPGDDALDALDPTRAAVLAEATGVPVPAPADGPLVRAAWLIGALTRVLRDTAARHPEWVVAWHEVLCVEPKEQFRAVADRLGLAWDEGGDRLLDELNRSGRGFETARIAAELPDVWRSRFSTHQVEEVESVLRGLQPT